MLGADVVVIERTRLLLGELERLARIRRQTVERFADSGTAALAAARERRSSVLGPPAVPSASPPSMIWWMRW